MDLSREQRQILGGAEGDVMAKCLRTLVEYGNDDLYDLISDGAEVEVDGDAGEIRVSLS